MSPQYFWLVSNGFQIFITCLEVAQKSNPQKRDRVYDLSDLSPL